MIGYVAKDKNGEVYLHTEEPVYEDEVSIPMSYPINTNFIVVEVYHE